MNKKTKKVKILFFILSAALSIGLYAVPPSASSKAVVRDTPEPDRLTRSDAVKFSIERSSELKNLDENAYINELNRSSLESAKVESITETQYINSLISLFQNELRQATFIENIALQRLAIESTVTRYFMSVLTAERELFLYDKNLELTKTNLDITKIKQELGMVSKNSYDMLKLSYDKDVSNREIKVISIDNAYRALNNAIGTELDKRWTLDAEIEYEPLEEYNLAQYIADSTASNVTVKAKENDLALAKYRLSVSTDHGAKDELEIGVRQAERALNDAKKSLNDRLVSGYKEIRSAETQYELIENDLSDMLSQLAIKETQLELGKLTRIDVDNYRYQILTVEYRLFGMASDHYIKVTQFKNPDLL